MLDLSFDFNENGSEDENVLLPSENIGNYKQYNKQLIEPLVSRILKT